MIFFKKNGFYHRECYKLYSNINELRRAEKRFNSLSDLTKSMVNRKVGRPSSIADTTESEDQQML